MKSLSLIRLAMLSGAMILILAAFGIPGCGSDDSSGEGDTADELATLPGDAGDMTLLDTSGVAEETPAEEAETKKEEPKVVEKPKPKEPEVAEKPKPKEPEIIKTTILAANSAMKVEMLTKVSTGENKIGDRFRASIKGPAEEGQTLDIPTGTILEGVVADINDGKAEGEKAFIKLKFTDFMMPGEKPIDIEGYIITDEGDGYIRPGKQGTTIAKDAGIGAVAGGVLGAITGKKGDKTESAAKGAVVGAAVGGIAGAILHQDQVTLKEGTSFNIGIVTPVIKETVKN